MLCMRAQKAKACTMTEKERDIVDNRHGALSGTSDWIRSAAMPFRRTGSCKMADWKKLLEVGLEYCFAEVVPAACSEAFWGIVHVLRKLLAATCDVASEDAYDHIPGAASITAAERELRQLKREIVLAVSRAEFDVPQTEAAISLHIILHVPDCIYRWNAVRNTWTFHSERYIN